MKFVSLMTFALLSVSAFASKVELSCGLYHNLELVDTVQVVLQDQQKNKVVQEYGMFQVILSSTGLDEIELQVLNLMDPSRSYATGTLKNTGEKIQLSIWTREFILDSKCTKI